MTISEQLDTLPSGSYKVKGKLIRAYYPEPKEIKSGILTISISSNNRSGSRVKFPDNSGWFLLNVEDTDWAEYSKEFDVTFGNDRLELMAEDYLLVIEEILPNQEGEQQCHPLAE